MERRIEDIEARLHRLEQEMVRLTHCNDAVETGTGTHRVSAAHESVTRAWTSEHDTGISIDSTFVGRTFVILAGAYLLRALTEMGWLSGSIGVLSGLAYGLWWLMRCDREAALERSSSATFYGIATAGITAPLLWESTARFGILSPLVAAIGLLGVVASALIVDARRSAATVVWLIVVSHALVALVLAVTTRQPLPFTATLLLLACGLETMAVSGRASTMRWPVAAAANLAALHLIAVAGHHLNGYPSVSPLPSILVPLALSSVYVVSVTLRTVFRKQPVHLFDVAQVPIALGIGSWATLAHMRSSSSGGELLALGVSLLVLGLGAYGARLLVSEDMSDRITRHFYGGLSGLLVLVGGTLLVPRATLAWLCAASGLAAAALAGKKGRSFLAYHSALFIAAAAVLSGSVTSAGDALLKGAGTAWRQPTACGVAATLAAIASYLMLARQGTKMRTAGVVSQALLLVLVIWTVVGLSVWLMVEGLPIRGVHDPGGLAVVRTAALVLAAVSLAWAGVRWHWGIAVRLVLPVLVIGGMKLLFEDLRVGRTETLSLSLAVYGGGMILAARLKRTTDGRS